MNQNNQFDDTMRNVQQLLTGCMTIAEKRKTIQFVMSLIRDELESSVLTTVLYGGRLFKENLLLFPVSYLDEHGEKHWLLEGEEVPVVMNKSCIVAHLDNLWSVWNTSVQVAYDPYTAKDYQALYYPELDVCYVGVGRQKVIAKKILGTSTIRAARVSLKSAFASIHTDGAYWYNTHTNEIIMAVQDFRMALLYELAKKEEELNSIATEFS